MAERWRRRAPYFVVPAKAGTQCVLQYYALSRTTTWIPAFAGMTGWASPFGHGRAMAQTCTLLCRSRESGNPVRTSVLRTVQNHDLDSRLRGNDRMGKSLWAWPSDGADVHLTLSFPRKREPSAYFSTTYCPEPRPGFPPSRE